MPYVEITGGNTSVTFDISTLDDSVLELDETITVTLDKVEDANDSAGTAGFHLLPTIDTSKSSSSLTIKPDAEKDAPEFSISGPAQIFDDGPVTFNINVSDAPIRPFPNTTLAHAVELVFEGTDPNTGAFHRYETRVFFPVGETDVSFTITESEMSKFPKDMTSLTATIKNVIAFEVNDWGGYETTPIISATNGAVDVPVIPFVISDALDIGDDYSNTVIKGTGGPGGKLVQLRDENGVVFGETLTTEDGTWEVNVNNATLENQAHQLTAVIFNGTDVSSGINQESKAILFSRSNEGVTSSQTASIEGISQEYIFTGNDNDIINISLNASNHVIVDGGAGGADKVVIDGFTNEFVSGKNAVGQTILTYVGNTNTVTTKVITLIDIEAVAFRDNETPIDVFDKSRVAILDGDGYLDKLDLNRTVYIGGQLVNNEEIVSITLVGKSDAGQTVSFNIDKEFITVDENGKIDARAHEIASQGFASGEITVIMLLDGSSDQLKDTSLITLNPPETIATITHISEDNGISDSDFITQDNQITIFGALDKALESDETLQLRVNQQWITIPSSSITSASDGSGFVWSYNDERFLPDGEYKYEARVVDETGLYSRSSQKTVVIDKENLFNSGSEVSFTRVSADTGKHTDDYVTSDSNFTLEGQLTRKLQDDEVLQLFDGEKWTEIYPTQSTNSEGITHGWSYSTNADLQDGDYSYELRVITKSGHLISSVQQTVTVDTKASTAIVEMTGISPDTGESDGDFITKENQGLVIRGTLSKVLATNEYLEVNLGGVWTQVPSDQITEIDGTVNWTYTDERTLPEGDYVYSFRVSDLAGNSTIEFTKPIFIDTNSASHTASTGAEIGNLKLVDDEGTKDTFLTKDTTIEIKGELSANIIRTDDSLEVFLDGQWQRINTSSQYRDGVFIGASWRLDLQDRELSEGKHDFEFRVVDTAGNITDSLTQSVEIDTTAGAPKVTIDSGNDHFINIKESQEPILVSVDLSDPAIQEGDTLNIRFMVNGKNAVTDEIPVTAEMLEQDTYSLHLPNEVIIDSKVITAVVSISDPADNIRIPDAALVTIDLTAPEAPTVNSLSTSTVKPTISGTAEMSSGDYLTVNIYSGTTLVASYDSKSEHLTIDNGSWSLTLPNELDDGNYTVKATTADEAGNSTEDSSSAVLTISPLADPQSSSPEDGLVTKSLEPQLAPTSNEFLIGDNGDDVMIDALDAPQMTLTSDSGMLTGHSETIEGFVLNEDKLDLSDLIALDNASDLENYLSITSDENSTTISVDKVGEPSQTITLEGVDLSNELQQRQTAVINTLFTNLGDEALLSPSNVSDEMTLNTKQLLDDEDITD
ncbi:MAG: Ig-like domain-containing protein [Psychrobium sp.]